MTALTASLLAATALAVTLCGIFLSGLFPRAARPAALRGTTGTLLIALALSIALVLAAVGGSVAAARLPWAVTVIAAGLGFLAGPPLFQLLPPAWTDTRACALALSGAGLALLGVWMAIAP